MVMCDGGVLLICVIVIVIVMCLFSTSSADKTYDTSVSR